MSSGTTDANAFVPYRIPFDTRFPADPWDRPELDDAFKGFGDGTPMNWLAAIRLAAPGPPSPSSVPGVDWTITLLDEAFTAPGFDIDKKPLDTTIKPPVAIISIATGESDVSRARDVGRPRLRAVVGYVHMTSVLFSGAELAWEGPGYRRADSLVLGSGNTRVFARISDSGLDGIRATLTGLELAKLPPRHLMALEWLGEAWKADVAAVKFVHLWFAVVAAIDSTFTRSQMTSTEQMERIRTYLQNLPISTKSRDEMFNELSTAYRLRNRLVHAGDRAGITPDALAALGSVTLAFLRADIGRT